MGGATKKDDEKNTGGRGMQLKQKTGGGVGRWQNTGGVAKKWGEGYVTKKKQKGGGVCD